MLESTALGPVLSAEELVVRCQVEACVCRPPRGSGAHHAATGGLTRAACGARGRSTRRSRVEDHQGRQPHRGLQADPVELVRDEHPRKMIVQDDRKDIGCPPLWSVEGPDRHLPFAPTDVARRRFY